jgi:radical SAM protein with 4Fe4S-binding SPASM domain
MTTPQARKDGFMQSPKIPAEFPDVIRIEASGRCNFRCRHCPSHEMERHRGILSLEAFHGILDSFRAHAFVPRVMVLYHGGEPLLNKDLVECVRVAKAFGVRKTVITTNASLLDANLSEALITAGLDEMKVSFDGETPEENNFLRRNGEFHRDASHVLEFLEIRQRLGSATPTVIVANTHFFRKEDTRAMRGGDELYVSDCPKYLLDFFAQYRDELVFRTYPVMKWPGYEVTPDFDLYHLDSRAKQTKHCVALFETCSILANGDVVPCCYDLKGETVFGNVFREDVFTIFSGELSRRFREGFRSGDMPEMCLNCPIVHPCYLIRR